MFVEEAGVPATVEAKPYRFEGAWFLRKDYQDIWKVEWANGEDDIVGEIKKVTIGSKEWNRKAFGKIFRRKRHLQARIKGFRNPRRITLRRGYKSLSGNLCRISMIS